MRVKVDFILAVARVVCYVNDRSINMLPILIAIGFDLRLPPPSKLIMKSLWLWFLSWWTSFWFWSFLRVFILMQLVWVNLGKVHSTSELGQTCIFMWSWERSIHSLQCSQALFCVQLIIPSGTLGCLFRNKHFRINFKSQDSF